MYGRRNVPFILDASTNPELTEKGAGKVFRTCGRDDRQGLFAARFMAEQLKAKRVAILHDNTTYSKGLADAANASVMQQGAAQVVYFDALQPGQSDYTPVLTKVATAKPDALYFTGYFAEAGLLVKQHRQLGLKFPLMGGDATTDATVLKTAGAAADGFMSTTAPLAKDLPDAAGFVAAFKAANKGTDPGPFSVYEYDAIKVLVKAIGDAKSTDGPAITKALHAIQGFKGISGEIGFDGKGDREGLVYISVQVKDGAFTGYKKLDVAGKVWQDVAA